MKVDLSIESEPSGKVVLHTVQSPEVYDLVVNQKKIYRCDPDLSDELAHPFGHGRKIAPLVHAYEWMADQMRQRIGPPPGNVHYPVWAWYSIDGIRKPDFRWPEYRFLKEKYVFQIKKDPKDILLSDEMLYYAVLNDCLLNIQPTEELYEKCREAYEKMSPEEQKIEKLKSWENIFVPPIPVNNGWYAAGLYMQATFWELRPEDVIQTKYLKPKKIKR